MGTKMKVGKLWMSCILYTQQAMIISLAHRIIRRLTKDMVKVTKNKLDMDPSKRSHLLKEVQFNNTDQAYLQLKAIGIAADGVLTPY